MGGCRPPYVVMRVKGTPMSINCKKLGKPFDRRQFLVSMGVAATAPFVAGSVVHAGEKGPEANEEREVEREA